MDLDMSRRAVCCEARRPNRSRRVVTRGHIHLFSSPLLGSMVRERMEIDKMCRRKNAVTKLAVVSGIVFVLSECALAGMIDSVTNVPNGPESVRSIPFELTGHRMCVTVKINENPKEYRFILDTGALTMIDESVAEVLHLEKGADMPLLEPSRTTWFARVHTIRLGQTEVTDMRVPVLDIRSVFGESFEWGGFIGSDFLKFFTVTIDYGARSLLFSDDSNSPDSTREGYRIHFEKHFMVGAPLVECTLNGDIETRAMIDTGSPFGFVLPLSFVERVDSSVRIRSKGVVAKWPFTSSECNYLSRIEELTVGTLHIRNLPVLFAELPANLSHPLLGWDFLSRFVLTLDYPSNELLLQPREGAHFTDNLFSTGLALTQVDDGRTVVRGFWEGSPADRSDIKLGDEILEINSRRAQDVSLREMKDILHDDAIREIELEMRSDSGKRRIVLKKEMLLPEIDSK